MGDGMKVNYSDEQVIKGDKSIFLAGPTPRSIEIETWRKEALNILEELGYDGIVYVPEREFDDRNFDYNNQVWWEREALHNANVVLFWIPRDIKTMPAFTTNVEFGYWISKNSDKVLYGRPDDSKKNKYLDWLYKTETGKNPQNDLKELLIESIKKSNTLQNDLDTYELNIIKNLIKEYPEILNLVGEIEFTPESFNNENHETYGRLLFKDTEQDKLKEFDRTILSVLLYYYIKDNRYDKFKKNQKGNNILTKESFDKLRDFLLSNFDTKEKEDLLIYYIVINDIGKSEKMSNLLKEKGIETVDHDLILYYLLEFNMLPSLNKFSEERKNNLRNVLNNGVNFGQFIQGECVDYSFKNLNKLNNFEKILMGAEAMLDIGGVLGHIDNKNGSIVLNESTTDNFITALNVVSNTKDSRFIFNNYLLEKASSFNFNISNKKIQKTITRLCLMMRLNSKEDINIVRNEIENNIEEHEVLINEFNKTGYEDNAILLYYSPALLNNTYNYFKKNNSLNPIKDALNICIPFIENILIETRKNIINDIGITTVMLRDAALTASTNPNDLSDLTLKNLSNNELTLKKIN